MRRAILLFFLLASAQLAFPKVEWSGVATDAIIGPPAILAQQAIFATYEGRLYSYSILTGKIAWAADIGSTNAHGIRLLLPDKIAAVTAEGDVLIIGAEKGNIISKVALGKRPRSIYAADGRIYVGYENGVSAISSAGKILWSYNLPSSPGNIGGGSGGRIYFTAGSMLYSINGASGALRWNATAGDSFLSRPEEVGGKVYLGSTDGSLYKFDAETGKLEWKFKTGGWVMSTPLVDEEGVFFGSNDGNFYSLSKEGKLRFAVPIKGEAWSKPISYEQNGRKILVIATAAEKLYGIDSLTGRVVWVFSTSGKPEEASLAGKSILFGTSKGKAYSFSTSQICGFTWPEDFKVVGDWQVDFEGKAAADGGVERVDVRANGGQWIAAEGKEDWRATVDLSSFEPGTITVECRTIGKSGMETGEFASVSLIKSKNAKPMEMHVSAPSQAGPDENITISAKDERGADLAKISVFIGQDKKIVDSPFAVVLGKTGPVEIRIEKSGYEPSSVVVVGRGGGFDLMAAIAAIAILAIVVIAAKKLGKKKG